MPRSQASLPAIATRPSFTLSKIKAVKDLNQTEAKTQKPARFWFLGSVFRLPELVEVNGIEPMTSCLQSRRSPN